MSVLEHDRALLRWSGSFGMALLVHVAVIGVVLWWHASRPAQPLPPQAQAVMVELAPSPTAPPTSPTDLPPGALQQEQRKAQPEAAPKPAPKPEPQQKPQEHAEVALPQQARQRQNDENANNDVAQTSAPPSVQASVDSRYAANQSSAGVMPQAMATWQSQILGRLEHFKQYSRDAQRRRLFGTVQVQFQVNRQGQVLAVAVVQGSGHDLLDDEAVATVRRASPLPPPPPEFLGDPVTVTTPVEFTLQRR